MAINHDQLFKELLTTFFVEFIELFFPEVLRYLDTSSITFVDKELFTDVTQGRKKILDVVALTKFREQDYSFLIHIEAQASQQTDFNRRMFRYFCSLFLKYDRPIYPIVVFSYNSPKYPEQNNFIIELPDQKVLDFNYQVVQLNRLSWRDFLNQDNPIASALMAKMNINQRDRPLVKAECLRLLVSFELNPAKLQLLSGFIDTYLSLNSAEEELFQSHLNTMELDRKEKIMQISTSWERKGRIEERISIVLRQLNRKIGQLPEELVTQIKSLESSQLETLTEDLLDFNTLDDLIQWLNCL